ncbi:hypothetical protein Snas_1527 [Stackebrandtia nassauensis DSM 44728]|uniref:Uncharacterized protein n=1 Tax=Stackebrandtia nassauensis (strain DSM 44728 / CIP 108903 / NRRL B-16338 / NBRC 102104 / LLR-40K-21) TaxID=446470 RepID=D3PW74_STANL|nr:hypothetical protein [Stackebrandtia nassauensis]ADD41231.1 hypothetical protein Snas_1527 [Stackebrandtia nassauensis DSM 44728]
MPRARHDGEIAVAAGRQEPVLVAAQVIALTVDQPHPTRVTGQCGEHVESDQRVEDLGDDVGEQPALAGHVGGLAAEHQSQCLPLPPLPALAADTGQCPVRPDQPGRRHGGAPDRHQPGDPLGMAGGRGDADVPAQRYPRDQRPGVGVDGLGDGVGGGLDAEALPGTGSVAGQIDRDHRTCGGQVLGVGTPHAAAQPDAVDEDDGGGAHDCSFGSKNNATVRCVLH